ncbi:MAG: phage tail tape measure protein [Pseudomonadota bacterium]|nr:phage tail tape measure protein [Pseudomonadota bacterium]
MADKTAELLLRLIDGVTGPAKAIKAELIDLDRLAAGFRRSGGLPLTNPKQQRELQAFVAGQQKANAQTVAAVRGIAAQDQALRRAASGLTVYSRNAETAKRSITNLVTAQANQTRATAQARRAVSGFEGGALRAEAATLARAGALFAPAAAGYAGAKAYGDFAQMERQLTRTGIKLGASRETMREIYEDMKGIANRYAVPVQEVMGSFDALAESGFSLADARAELDGVVKATQGLGGDGRDTVATFDAARKSIGVARKEAEAFFDIIAAGGAAGKFEGSDLARYLPSLLPVAARQGYQGLEGAARLVGLLEVVRDYVGTSEEAATAVQDIFEKISSPDVLKNFRGFGVDLEERLKAARDEGKDVLMVLAEIMREITQGDTTKLSQLFGDRDSRRTANVLLTALQRVIDAQDELRRKSRGTITTNVEIVTEDAQARIDRLTNSWEAFKKNVGAGIAVAATPALDEIHAALERGQAYQAGLDREMARGGSKSEAREEFNRRYGEANPDFQWWNPSDLRERSNAFVQAVEKFGRKETETIYADLDRIISSRRNVRFPGLKDSIARAEAWAKRQAEERSGNLDGQDVTRRQVATPHHRPGDGRPTIDGGPVARGVPAPFGPDQTAPVAREVAKAADAIMSLAKQMEAYGRGRLKGEEKARDRRENMPARIRDFSDKNAKGWRGGGFDEGDGKPPRKPDEPWFSAPSIGLRVGPFTPSEESRKAADDAWRQMQGGGKPIEVPVVPKIDEAAAAAAIGQALSVMSTKASEAATMLKSFLGFATGPTVDTSSIDAATGKAAVAGPAMRDALSVSATVQVNSGSIDAAIGKANALRQALAGLGAATGGLRSGGAVKPSSAGSAIGAMVPPVDGARAAGGPVRPGNWLVGEKGPEILQLFGRGYVHNARDSRAILRSPKYHDPMTAFVREPRDGAPSGSGSPSLAGAIGNTHNTTNHWNPTFNIRSTDPKGAADEIGRVLLRANRRSLSTAIDGRRASWER